jgi:FKBP-type peptidyl-prolyl cis-trans isomerase FklB
VAWQVYAQQPQTQQPGAQAPGAAPAAPAELKNQISYIIGMNMGRNLKSDELLEIDQEMLIRGLKDALSDAKPLLSEQEMQQAIGVFQQQMAKKQQEVAAKQQAGAAAAGDKNQKEGEAYLAKNKTQQGVVTLPSGLQYKVLKSGNGATPKATDTVKTHYHGTLIDGTVFDSSVQRGEPISFPVNGVIKGWTEALQLMKVGDKWQLFIPSSLAYGANGAGPKIGPNTTLIFEVELLGVNEK